MRPPGPRFMGQSKTIAIAALSATLALFVTGGLVLPEGIRAQGWDGTASTKDRDDTARSGTRVVVRLDPFPVAAPVERDDASPPAPDLGLWSAAPAALEPAAPPVMEFTAISPASLAQMGADALPALTLAFSATGENLDTAMREALDRLAAELVATGERIQLLGYAAPEMQGLSSAKRLALRRAVAVRKYLVGQGIAQTRIDVRAIGAAKSGEPDRVDIVRP